MNLASAARLSRVDDGACVGVPLRWDLDVLGDDHAAAVAAQLACATCPALHRCRSLLGAQPTPPRQVIWAATAFDDDGQPVASAQLREHMRSTMRRRQAADKRFLRATTDPRAADAGDVTQVA